MTAHVNWSMDASAWLEMMDGDTTQLRSVAVDLAPALPRSGPESWHGTVSGYTNHKCRCSLCRGYWAERARGRLKTARERGA